jgi:DNA-binding response OmpR family regulator
MKILLVDDDDALLSFLAKELETRGLCSLKRKCLQSRDGSPFQ